MRKETTITIRLSSNEKTKVEKQAKKMQLNTSAFIREHFIKLITEK